MKHRTKLILQDVFELAIIVGTMIALLVIYLPDASAQEINQVQTQTGTAGKSVAKSQPAIKANQKQQQQQAMTSDIDLYASASSTADGGSVSVSSSGGNDTVFVPNNNTESCLRVFGIAFPTKDGSAILGLPWRSQPCDLEASADDAFAQGNVVLGWMFKCQMKANKKAMGGYDACIAKATNSNELMRELVRLKEQNTALRDERGHEITECEQSKNRVTGRLMECLKK